MILLKSPAGEITTAAFSLSEEHLAVGTAQGDILIWTLGGADQAIRIPSGHGTGVTDIAFFDGDGIVSSGQQDGQIRIRSLTPGLPAATMLSGLRRARFGSDDDQILGVEENSNRPAVRMLSSAASPAVIVNDSAPAGANWYPTRGGFLSLDFENKSGAVWPATPAETPLRRFRFADYRGDRASNVAISDDGGLLAWVDSYDTSVWLIDLTLPKTAPFRLRDQPIRNTLWSSIAADGAPTDVLSIDTRDWSAPVAISPDKSRLAIGAGDGTVRVWTLSEAEALPLVLRGLGRWPLSLAFSSDGDLIAAGSTQRTIGVWRFSDERLVTLRGHEGRVDAVAFAPKRRLLASGGPDGTVRLWDLDTEDPQPTLLEESTRVQSLEFSPSGERLIVSLEGSAHVWTVAAATLATSICETVSRNLSLDEWRGFVGPDFGYERTCPNLPVHASLLETARMLAKASAMDLRDLGSYEEGLRDLEAAATLDPENPEIADLLRSYAAQTSGSTPARPAIQPPPQG